MISANRHIIIDDPPAWMPPVVRENRERVEVSFRFSQAERRIYRKRRKIQPSVWAERHRVITRGPLEGSTWRNRTTPYLAGIMDASFFPGVHVIIICAPPQTGKSAVVDTCIGYAADRDPGPVLYVYPDEDTATENSKDRIQPMFRKGARLRSYLTGTGDDETAKRINLQHMQIYMAWARSAVKLGNKSIRYGVGDEVDKYPDVANKREGGPLDLMRKRFRTYRWNYKFWIVSTPTIETGAVWTALTTEAQVIFDYHVRCPDCRTYQEMKFDGIKWPKDERDPEKIEAQRLAWYECPHCHSQWDDTKRDAAVRAGQWRDRETGRPLTATLDEMRPAKIGFHLRSWISPFVGLSDAAAAFLRGTKDKNKLKDFKNGHAAEPWRNYMVERKEDRILALRDDRPAGIVPGAGQAAALVAGVDTQDHGFYYRIRAFGWGPKEESWGVRMGFVDSFEALKEVLFDERVVDSAGTEYAVKLAIQDAMGHRTNEVYDFVRLRQGAIFAAQGVDTRRMATPISWSNLEFYPGTKKPIPGGLRLLRHDANYWKNKLAGKLEVNPEDPGAFHLEAEADMEYARNMCAEVLDDKGLWVCQASKANHFWDCEVLCLVAAEILRVRFWPKPGAEKKAKPPAPQRPAGGGWLGKRGGLGEKKGWLRKN